MEKSSLFIEIFGLDEIAAPPLRGVPAIPVMDEDPQMRKGAGHAADAMIERIKHAEMVSKLAPIPEQARLDRDVAKFSPIPHPEPFQNFVKNVLTMGKRSLDRKAQIAKAAPRRRHELREIAERCVGGLLPRSDAEFVKDSNFWLDSFAESAEKLTSEILLEANRMSKQSDFRPIYVDPQSIDQRPVQRPDLDDLRTGTQPLQPQQPELTPRCWRCQQPIQLCRCGGM